MTGFADQHTQKIALAEPSAHLIVHQRSLACIRQQLAKVWMLREL